MAQNNRRRQLRRRKFSSTTGRVLAALVFCLPLTSIQADSWTATVDWAQRLELGPLVGGAVTATYAETGDRVSAGTEMMKIDPAPYLHEVHAAEARVESTLTDFESSRQHHERQEELYAIGSLSTVQLEDSEYARKRAESAHRLAQARLEQARYNLDMTTTHAPFDAWVIDKRVFVGQNLSTNQAIPVSYVVAPAGKYIATVTMPPETGGLLQIGTGAEVEVNGSKYAGKVTFPPLASPPDTGRMTISFSGKDLLLLPGTQVIVTINQP